MKDATKVSLAAILGVIILEGIAPAILPLISTIATVEFVHDKITIEAKNG